MVCEASEYSQTLFTTKENDLEQQIAGYDCFSCSLDHLTVF
jgi:hypothetical protein